MEDKYLYKAKTTPKEKGEFNNVWVVGNLIVSNGRYYIHPAGNVVNVENEIGRIIVMHEVIPETICKCTGLKDKNGKLIWENDILDGFTYPYMSDGAHNYYAEVCWCSNVPAFGIYTQKYPKSKVRGISAGMTEIMGDWNSNDWEVIGNIFDNKELLESEE